MAETFTVGALSARTGVSRQALRVYEAARILTPMARTPSGYRVYGHEAVKVDGMLRDLKAMRRRLGALVVGDEVRIGEAGNLAVLKKERVEHPGRSDSVRVTVPDFVATYRRGPFD